MSILATIGGIVGGHDGIHPVTWNNMSFAERLAAYDWRKELFIGATLLLYVFVYVWGVRKNRALVDRWLKTAKPVLEAEFAEVGVSPTELLMKDSPSRYTTYASGRLNIESVLARFYTTDRHNAVLSSIGLVVPSLRSIDGLEDEVVVEITPTNPAAIEPFIFAIVNKLELQRSRDDNYYLSLTRTVDSDKLPQGYAFMYEHGDLAQLLTPELSEAIANAGDILKYFAVTDQRRTAPTKPIDLASVPKLYISFRYPGNATEEAAVGAILSASIRFVDYLVEATKSKKLLRPELIKKLKLSREDELAKLLREEETRKKEDLEREKAEKRKEELKKREKLPEKEQRKLAKKEQEKLARKQQKKSSRRA